MGEPPPNPLDHDRGQELLAKEDPAHPNDTHGGVLELRWRIGNPWLLDRCDEEAGGRSNPN